MFTGIIEELGTVTDIKKGMQSLTMSIMAKVVLGDIGVGDSIAVNGVCLTVTSYASNQFTLDIMPETYKATSLAAIKVGDKINLERSLRLNGKLGGHFVTGHVDGIGIIKKVVVVDNAINYRIQIDKNLMQYCIYKGGVAIDGTSLTIFGLGENYLDIALIPHTVKNSIIGSKKIGDVVNVECDMQGKYILNLAKSGTMSAGTNITLGTLTQNGFV